MTRGIKLLNYKTKLIAWGQITFKISMSNTCDKANIPKIEDSSKIPEWTL